VCGCLCGWVGVWVFVCVCNGCGWRWVVECECVNAGVCWEGMCACVYECG